MNHPVPPLRPEEFSRQFADIHPPFDNLSAAAEANRCLFCFDAPCTSACPTHIDVPRFIKKIASGNLRGSAMTILDANVLGLSCSRVCPVDVLCEGACVMHRYNKEPIEIGRLQRHAMETFHARGGRLKAAEGAARGRVACLGGGPASLACAAELRRSGVGVVVFEARALAGGLNTYGIAEYKFRPSDSLKEVELVRSMGVEFRTGMEVGRDISVEQLEKEFDAIFIGVGLGSAHALGVEGETLSGVTDAVRFIANYKTATASVGRRVVVIGAGNTAIDAATAAVRLGAAEVTIAYRRAPEQMPAFRYEYELAKHDGIKFLWLAAPVRVHGTEAVEGLEFRRMELGPPDPSGRRSPRPVPGDTFRVDCDMVIASIGQSRLIRLLETCAGVRLRDGRVEVSPQTGQTSNPKYYAGGDCANGGKEVVDAVAEGKRAGLGIVARLRTE